MNERRSGDADRAPSATDDDTLSYGPLWQAIGALLIGAVLYESLTPAPIELPLAGGDKYGHLLAYASLMFWFAQIHVRATSRMRIACALILMGIAVEFVQRATGYRTFDVLDMAANVAGVCVGWLAAPSRSLLRFLEPVQKRAS